MNLENLKLTDNYKIYSKRKTSYCLLKKGVLPGLYFNNIEYNNFNEYQKNIFNKKVIVPYQKIIENYPSVYSLIRGGGTTARLQAFCGTVNILLKEKYPEVTVTTDSRRKLKKKCGGKGARTRRQKSYR